MKKKMMLVVIGVVMILIALILGLLQHFYYGSLNPPQSLYGDEANKWYFYGLVGVIGLIGIILAAWSLMIVEGPSKATEPAQPAQ